MAEGSRGRRWRFIRTTPDGGSLTALLETAADGRPQRLEVASAAGLLVLHPEGDEREAHGNVVSPDGVRPLAFPWSSEHLFSVAGLPWVAAACAGAAGNAAAPVACPVLRVDTALGVAAATLVVGPADSALPERGARWELG